MIYLRQAMLSDLPSLLSVISEARQFLAGSGTDQWQGDYPQPADIRRFIRDGAGYVLLVEQVGTPRLAGFCALIPGEDPAYSAITDGEFFNQSSTDYLAVHCIALGDEFRGRGLMRDMFSEIFSLSQSWGIQDIRVDTHPMNLIMRHVFEREGFVQRGHVQIEGDRIAYQMLL